MHRLMAKLFPLNRSLTGDGVRETLRIIQEHIPLETHEVPTGTKVFDWEVPNEWRLNSARLVAPYGSLVLDTHNSNLHVVGYSEPFKGKVEWERLKGHIYSSVVQPDAIPYVTSYYHRTWGFCMRHRDFERLRPGTYHVNIDTELFPGSLTYGDLVIEGETSDEIVLSSYCCHPSMANNELSGPVVLVELVKWWMQEKRRHTLRVVLAPETIGTLTYLSQGNRLEWLKQRAKAVFVLTCLGGPGEFTLQAPRPGRDNLAYDAASHVLACSNWDYEVRPWEMRISDERQWCAPGIDLPACTIMKTAPGDDLFPQYHTSLDDLSYVTEEQLRDSFELIQAMLRCLEANRRHVSAVTGEPQLGKRGLYSTLSMVGSSGPSRSLLDTWSYADGRTLLENAEEQNRPFWDVKEEMDVLLEHGIVREYELE